jgi:hypothetical protein
MAKEEPKQKVCEKFIVVSNGKQYRVVDVIDEKRWIKKGYPKLREATPEEIKTRQAKEVATKTVKPKGEIDG